jgi:hypothetical protein
MTKKRDEKKEEQPTPQVPEQKFPMICETCKVLVDEDTYCGETAFGYQYCVNKYRQTSF